MAKFTAEEKAAIAAARAEILKPDPINPSHYTHGGIECIDAIKASMDFDGFTGFLKGQVFKYLWRLGRKDDTVQELKKPPGISTG